MAARRRATCRRSSCLLTKAATDATHVLILPETTGGGWTARGNGVRLPVFSANGAFLAVRVPAGETEIVCRYLPPGLRAGAAVSIASTLAVLLLAALRRGGRWSLRST